MKIKNIAVIPILMICGFYNKTYSQKNIYSKAELEYHLQAVALPVKTKNIKKLITSHYGNRKHPITGETHLHNGIDIAVAYVDVFSVALGWIEGIGFNERSGNYIIIKHLNGITSSYCHLSEINVAEGTVVVAGMKIGVSGNSGSSTGPHLHFTIKVDGKSINPYLFLINVAKKLRLE